MPRKPSKTAPRAVESAARRKKIMALRMAGYTLQQIADQMGIAKQSVHKHVKEGLAADHEATRELAAEYREIELQRLEALHAAFATAAAGGDDKAAGVVLKASDQRAKLLALYTTKTEITGKDGGAIKTEAGQGAALDLTKLTDDQLAQFVALAEAASQPQEG